MTTRLPTPDEIDELTAFLPRLYAEGFSPLERPAELVERGRGKFVVLGPSYDAVVLEFIDVASRAHWADYDYRPEAAGPMLADVQRVKRATLAEIKTLLTFCVRGERFSDGFWASMITDGHVRRLLERLRQLRAGGGETSGAETDRV